ncbi:SUN domain-containing protein 2-like, partial [Vombatus ursinus]|uniref:SUN domain-containing protein 2-like n=1 Tax=Vombatus ursinus TaxID=29139 RepID=UPI000FFDA3F0
MSRRSERLRLRYQALGDGGNSSSSRSSSSSGGNSQVAEQHTNWREGPFRTLRRKSSRVKGFSPGLSPAPHLALYTCNTPESSSGYFSEDDSAGHSVIHQPGSASTSNNGASQVGIFNWMAIYISGWLFAAFQWCLGNAWHCLTTAASLQDFFLLIRSFFTRKKLLLFVLGMLFFVASLAYGAWCFYPYGLQTFHPAMLSWWAARGSSRREDRWEPAQSPSYFQELESEVVQKTSEWHSSSQEEKRPKEMDSLEAQLVGLRQELVALSQRQAEVQKELHLWPEKMAALRNEVESKVPGWIERVLGIKQEEVQAQLHDLEHRIVSHVAQEWPKSVSKAAAILRLSLLKEGMTTGVTKEV